MFNKQTAVDIRRYGLTQAQFGIVESLGHLGFMTLGDIARKQLSSCGNTTVVVDNLEKNGLVERRPCKEDRRAVYLHLTPKGQRLFDDIFRQHARCVQQLASALSEEEQKHLSALLKKLGLSLSAREEQE